MEEFLSRCFYQPGQYASDEDFGALGARMAEREAALPRADRMFYLSIPPNIFTAVVASASRAASSKCAARLCCVWLACWACLVWCRAVS